MMLGLGMSFVIAATVTVDRREVTVGDLVRHADGRHFAGTGEALAVLRLPAARRQTVLPAASLAALVRRRLPALAITSDGTTTITLRPNPDTAMQCWATLRAIAADEAVTRREVAAVPCLTGQPTAAMRTARDGTAFLATAQPAGTPLGRFLPAPVTRIAAGTALTLRSVHGPVAIERPVVTMQPGRSGNRVFVRDGAGRVFAAPLTIAEDAR
ncbi:hypothetical protein [Sphingomonas sp. Leaf4]|uniref:hypothetical protein n=1 Tax=Sphingomonas sp. Leaf4 TaxID=2876553 RepID=UPI001E4D90D5|nr:hypothetical protein [Sphingomonas sp. Leaf4]